jgi:hypothetical protein
VATDDDIDDWSARVSGRGDAADPPDGVPGLRDAIRRTDAEAARTGAADRVGLERLLRRLEGEGLLERGAAPGVAPGRKPGRRPAWIAAAASVALAVVGLRLLLPPAGLDPVGQSQPPPPVEASRGFAGVLKQTVADPEVAAAEVERELAGLGFAARRAPAAGRVIIEVDVTPERVEAFHEWVAPRGGRAVSPGRYRVILEPAS